MPPGPPRVADLDLVAEPRQVVGGRQSARSRADDQDALAGRCRRWFERPAALPGEVAEESLDRVDRHRAVEMCSVADSFTRVIAHPAMDCGERVVRDQLPPRRLRVALRWRAPARPGCSPRLDSRRCTAAASRHRRVGVHVPGRRAMPVPRSASGVTSSASAISRGSGRWCRASAERPGHGIPPRSRRRHRVDRH